MRLQLKHAWERPPVEVFELAGKTMVLVGLGDIGARTARLAAALEMRVIGVERNPLLQVPGVERLVGVSQLRAVLAEAEVVVLTIPHTPTSTHLMGPAEFEAMKAGVYFVNIGRGKNVDEAALIAALQSGKIAGAGLDVFEIEPLPADSPLWDMENVIITSHYAGATPAYQARAMAIFIENLRRYRTGEALHNAVDKKLGY
jgi:phosphoglycerate dehydrogenase-like enzyme